MLTWALGGITADLGLFAGAWLKSGDEVDPADYPECRACEGEISCPTPGVLRALKKVSGRFYAKRALA